MEIKLEHVTKKIKGVPVLQDVTKTFTGGCIYGLSGKNGCGKTPGVHPCDGFFISVMKRKG